MGVQTEQAKPVMMVGGIGLDKDLQSSFMQDTHMVNNLAAVADRFRNHESRSCRVRPRPADGPGFVSKLRSGAPFQPFRLQAYGSLD